MISISRRCMHSAYLPIVPNLRNDVKKDIIQANSLPLYMLKSIIIIVLYQLSQGYMKLKLAKWFYSDHDAEMGLNMSFLWLFFIYCLASVSAELTNEKKLFIFLPVWNTVSTLYNIYCQLVEE